MPITPINFAAIDPIDFKDDIFSGLLKMREAQHAGERRGLKNEGMRHQNSIQGAKAQYAPDMEKFTAMLQQNQAENYNREIESKIGLNQAHANHANSQAAAENNKLTDASKYGKYIPGSLDKLPKAEQHDTTKRMKDNLVKAENLMQMGKELKEFKKLMKEHPNMSEAFNNILLQKEPGIISQVWRKFNGDKKGLDALNKAQKLGNSALLRYMNSLGGGAVGKRGVTDFLAKIMQSAKVNPLNTDATNQMIIDSLLEENAYADAWKKKTKEGLDYRFPVYDDYDDFRPESNSSNEKELSSMSDAEIDAIADGPDK